MVIPPEVAVAAWSFLTAVLTVGASELRYRFLRREGKVPDVTSDGTPHSETP